MIVGIGFDVDSASERRLVEAVRLRIRELHAGSPGAVLRIHAMISIRPAKKKRVRRTK